MHFDLGLFTGQVPPESAQTPGERYRELLGLGPHVEALGFEKAWVSEHHFVADGYLPSVLPFCSALAARTSDLRIGTGIALAPFYDPLRFAEDAATVDLLSNGRFEPGLAIGWTDPEFAAFSVPKELRVPYTEELIAVARQAWEGPVNHAGRVYEYDGVDVHPKPAQADVPIWLAGTVDAAVERAARLGDGYFATPTPLDELARRNDLLRRTATDPESVELAEWRYAYVAEEGAWETAKHGAWYIKRQYLEWATGESQPAELPPSMEADLREECLMGSPAEVRAAVKRRRDRLDDDYRLVARMTLPGLDASKIERSMELFADEVIDEV